MAEDAPDMLPGLANLKRGSSGNQPFLDTHHVAAAERFHRLFRRAHLSPRITMHFGPRTGSGGANGAPDISDMAADARKALAGIQAGMPSDCATALIDICGFEKGVQTVEIERGWPRRSGKIVLRIALEHLARHFGLVATAEGPKSSRQRSWLPSGARPTEFS